MEKIIIMVKEVKDYIPEL
jgi:hypothetical protein